MLDDSKTPPAFLGVARSVTGRRWVGPDAYAERLGLAIAQTAALPEIVGRVLALRGVGPEEAEGFLAPTLRALMPDPSRLADMDRAAERLALAVRRRERIALFGDYDVDGAASVALMLDWLGALGLEATPYIPDRIDEGYGPNLPAMTGLGAAHDLLICLDCGSAAPEPIAAACRAGADVLVVDHHLTEGAVPGALAVVNPNRADCPSGQGHLCAAGVAFLLLAATNRALRGQGAFAGRPEPDLRAWLDLVALATIADVTPLIGLNRAFVRQGLGVLARRGRPGLAALADVAGLTAPPSARDLGFALGPRINAGGRVGAADLGTRLLATRCPDEAAALAARLDGLNRERREIEAAVLAAAAEQAEARGADGPLVWAAGEGWHAGVVGIVASRLKDRFNRPAVVIGLDGAEGKGSGRSVPGVDLGSAVAALAAEGLLLKGGGHRMAAGLTVAAARLEAAMDALGGRLAAQGAGTAGPEDLAIDGALAPGGASVELVARLEAAGPFGPANPAPRLAFAGVRVQGVKPVGTGHMRCRFAGPGGSVDAIAFRAEDSGLAAALADAGASGQPVHAAGRLEIDDWGGRRRAKLRLEDLAIP
ncbi:single-stranded-DNA-specific exonuclease RecJ [Paralimibaculum aggregatum]|uniref:Single-stranded-DNA-specific exonuclease RecJ n=1 Tax=Paralimibaculum aggregatum TaxID=3036245 RepID=A0ABQ6LBP3_9RHOB|nr:single-stranded-DNA-specific exonuclease RecJ [Limibaculum sp. NKW23]GMG80821.1 single-stranded-DNA-specific exonuclease RecJ [Limibaculum sp. NKW23]